MKRILALLTVGTVGAVVPVTASDAQDPAFPTGSWIATMSLRDTTTVASDEGNIDILYDVLGGFDARSANGNLTGNWSLTLNTYVTADGFETQGYGQAIGEVTGFASVAMLELDLVIAGSNGIEFTFTAEELPTPGGGDLFVRSADCQWVSGDWVIDFNGDLLEGEFTALATDDLDADGRAEQARADLEAFNEQGREALADIRSGTWNPLDLQDLFAQADGIMTQYTTQSSCGDEGNRSSHRHAASELVKSILFELSGDPGFFSTEALINLILSGYRSGFFDGDDGAEDLWLGEYDQRVAAAVEGRDPNEVARIASFSEQLGRTEEAAAMWGLYEELIGEEGE